MVAQGVVATSICDCSISVMTLVAQFFDGRESKNFLSIRLHGAARLGVEHEVFFFHADRVHARNNTTRV